MIIPYIVSRIPDGWIASAAGGVVVIAAPYQNGKEAVRLMPWEDATGRSSGGVLELLDRRGLIGDDFLLMLFGHSMRVQIGGVDRGGA